MLARQMPFPGGFLGIFRVFDLVSARLAQSPTYFTAQRRLLLLVRWDLSVGGSPCARKAQCVSGDPHSKKAETGVGPLDPGGTAGRGLQAWERRLQPGSGQYRPRLMSECIGSSPSGPRKDKLGSPS